MTDVKVGDTVVVPCPTCGTAVARTAYDVGSGPELSCYLCEWCWGANGQDLKPLSLLDVAARMTPEQRAASGLDRFLPPSERDLPDGFHCEYADGPGRKCDMCDCFVDTYPDDPFGLHPEAFLVNGHQYPAINGPAAPNGHHPDCPGCAT